MKTERIKIATNTLEILDRGNYTNPNGTTISIKDEVKTSVESSILYTPHALDLLGEKISPILGEIKTSTCFDVVDATTLQAAHELSTADATDILVLNFASAKNPGGGFLNGSQAQEESIARSSGLYPTLLKNSEMYRVNKMHGSCLYTEHMIYSPSVPVFKTDDGKLFNSPYLVSIITSPAVNAGAIKRNEPENINKIEPVMIGRIENVLSVAIAHGHKNIILGAWGCGVFENDPQHVATYFGLHLIKGRFKNKFNRVIFAIKSKDERFIEPFKKLFPNKLPS